MKLEGPTFDLLETPVELELPTAPLIFVGHTGSGKSTLMRAVESLNSQFRHSMARFSTRMPRNKGELKEGYFVSQDDFDLKRDGGEFAYHYARYGNEYGFHTDTLREELQTVNPMLVGGKEDTSRALRNALDAELNPGMEAIHPVVLYVSRSIDKVREGILSRDGSKEEKARRIAALERGYTPHPVLLSDNEVHIINNEADDPEVGAQQVIEIANSFRSQVLRDLLGSNATMRDWENLTLKKAQ